MSTQKEDALIYHSMGRRGKIEVVATKPCFTSRDLSLAYTPGVAEPCREIAKNEEEVFKYTAKGNLVAVVSNGSAVLGLGDIGASAGKPVMEGKGILFKRFADIDVFDIELNSSDPAEIINTVKLLEPTFGGINLEDIKAPDCFIIEEELVKTMSIPVFHDDQHGTAIISCAALLNAAEIAGKELKDMRILVSGAGASAIACSNLYLKAGVRKENIFMFDSKGLLSCERNDLNKYKMAFCSAEKDIPFEDAFDGADMFLGLSKGDLVTKEMVKKMAPNPIVFAMANPDPEIKYEDAVTVRKDLIMATGRSDYPNQVNNVLGFPFIFRGALDVRASKINEEMKMAAVKALAELAREKVPDVVIQAYGNQSFQFGRDYIIPKPFDPRVLWKVAPAVAKAAIESGVAAEPITDWKQYIEELKERLGFSKEIIRVAIHKAQKNPKKIVYPDGQEEKIIRAAHQVFKENIGLPVLLGDQDSIKSVISELNYDIKEFEIIDPGNSRLTEKYSEQFYNSRQRKGLTRKDAAGLMKNPSYYGAMMVKNGEASALIGGYAASYPQTIRPALQCLGLRKGSKIVSGLYIIIIKSRVFFFADTTVNIDPTSEQLAEIAISAADTVKDFDIVPKVAMLSFSNFGSASNDKSNKVKVAVEIVKKQRPDIIVDGEMQADTAVVPSIVEEEYPFCEIKGGANVLVFPDLNSGNIAYKLMAKLADSTVIGPILMGISKPVHVLQKGCSVEEIINMSAIAVVDAIENISR